MTVNQVIEERRKREAEERRIRIRESKYNIHYRKMAKEELPRYSEGRMKWRDRKILTKLGCGNDTNG